MIANKPRDFFAKTQIATEISKHAPANLHADQRVLGGMRSARCWINMRRRRLACVVK
jgi:hypothetical protein